MMPSYTVPRDADKFLKDMDELIKENDMKNLPEGCINNPFIYYFRDRDNRPIVTIAIAKRFTTRGSDGINMLYFRGISICSPRDKPNKTTGRNIAIGRLKAANMSMRSTMPIKRGFCRLLTYSAPDRYEFSYKSGAAVELTKYERKLFRDASKRMENNVRNKKGEE
jgi:hypothetical protein